MKWLMLPLARYHWAAAVDARKAEDWQSVVRHCEAVQRYWETDENRFLLGSAYGKIERFDEAVDQLRRIVKPLADEKCEQERWLNLAVSLWHLGRVDEALAILPEEGIEEHFPDYAKAAKGLRDRLVETSRHG